MVPEARGSSEGSPAEEKGLPEKLPGTPARAICGVEVAIQHCLFGRLEGFPKCKIRDYEALQSGFVCTSWEGGGDSMRAARLAIALSKAEEASLA